MKYVDSGIENISSFAVYYVGSKLKNKIKTYEQKPIA